MMRSLPFVIAVAMTACVCLLLLASPGYADIYKWVDKNGTIWLTDDPRNLPKEAQGQFERIMTTEESPESPASEGGASRAAVESENTPPVGAYLEKRDEDLEDKEELEWEISMLEQNLSAAKRALKQVPLTDRRGYWFVIDRKTGEKVPASYKDPGAIWATQTWPVVPREKRTKESEERRRIQSDIERFERELDTAKRELSEISRP